VKSDLGAASFSECGQFRFVEVKPVLGAFETSTIKPTQIDGPLRETDLAFIVRKQPGKVWHRLQATNSPQWQRWECIDNRRFTRQPSLKECKRSCASFGLNGCKLAEMNNISEAILLQRQSAQQALDKAEHSANIVERIRPL